VGDAVAIGLSAMIGAGIFVVLGPAAAAAGGLLPLALLAAALVAFCNAYASARLARRMPFAGGTYVYGRELLGPFWGHLAGWGFVVGKTASCGAMALTVGLYAWPQHARPVAATAVLVLLALGYRGVQRPAWFAKGVVTVVLLVLGVVVLDPSLGPVAPPVEVSGSASAAGVLQGAGLLFFAFAGYARIATLGEEVRDPDRTISRAVPLALGVTLVVYAAVTWAVVRSLGIDRLATEPAAIAAAAGDGPLGTAVRVAAVLAALGALLALLLGVSRTVLAMARDRHLPAVLAAVHARHGVPHRAEAAVALAVLVLVATVEVRHLIGFSSLGILVYYAVANAAAWRLGGRGRVLAAVGLAGCLVLAGALPPVSVVVGLGVLAVGAAAYLATRRQRPDAATYSGDGPTAPHS